MRKVLSVFFTLSAIALFSQTTSPALVPFGNAGKWGFADFQRKIKIAPVYDRVEPFSSGVSIVVKNKKCGAIDSAGKVIVPFKFWEIESFKNGFAVASTEKDKCVGLINTKGEFVLPEKFRSIQTDKKTGFMNCKDSLGVSQVYDKSARLLLANAVLDDEIFSERYVIFERKEKFFFEKKDLNKILRMKNVDDEVLEDTLRLLRDGFFETELIGMFDLATGKEIIKPQFTDMDLSIKVQGMTEEKLKYFESLEDSKSDFIKGNEDYFYVLTEGPLGTGLWSFKDGQVIPPVYKDINEDDLMEFGKCIAEKDSLDVLIDLKGKELTTGNYNWIKDDFASEWLITENKKKLKGIVSRDGKKIVDPVFNKISIKSHFALGEFSTKQTFIYGAKEGKDPSAFKLYDKIYGFYELLNTGLLQVKTAANYGVMDTSGKEILKTEYSQVNVFKNAIIAKKKNANILFDKTGKEIFQKKHEWLIAPLDEKNDFILSRKGNELGYFDKGKFISLFACRADEETEYHSQFFFKEEAVTFFTVNGKLGALSVKAGKVELKLKPEYSPAEFIFGRMPVSDSLQNYGMVSNHGDLIISVGFTELSDGYSESGDSLSAADFIVGVNSKKEMSIFDRNGKKIFSASCDGGYSLAWIYDGPEPVFGVNYTDNGNYYSTVYNPSTKKMNDYLMTESQILEEGGNDFGMAIVKDNNARWALVNKSWNPITKFKYSNLQTLEYDPESDNYLLVFTDENNKSGLLSDRGTEICAAKYDQIEMGEFPNGIMVTLDGKKGLIAPSGKEIVPPLYAEIMPSEDHVVCVDFEDYVSVYDLKGNVLLKNKKYKNIEIDAVNNIGGRWMPVLIFEQPKGGFNEVYTDPDGNLFYQK